MKKIIRKDIGEGNEFRSQFTIKDRKIDSLVKNLTTLNTYKLRKNEEIKELFSILFQTAITILLSLPW